MSQITSHILDTSRGKPAAGITISLFELKGSNDGDSNIQAQWSLLAQGQTNSDGRVPALLEKERILPAGSYRVHFAVSDYFNALNEQAFYPYVDIVFDISGDGEHYHIPLLLTAFGYSTYRGS
ncbi:MULTISPECIES: hydroxyisourate hydrolase [unclassified Colwellia]|jgi:5-hydroxyisourate hydrolase|uniref:hydroxyisourate hydrolase n=1 Tax=unclassified Colwellia TaxID=196834 RepID=UPI0015F5836D|nr:MULTISPECIES: hydroxyisourate hydrolase [unclassified Colwellia]MBA6251874.1 hydroxyisourate hydrolase [Colwellia sp. MB3u-55]MBA6398381.1 hydroxyisourate hydrolase [Colwellia sp. BRX10-4]